MARTGKSDRKTLGENVAPVHYSLYFEPDLKKFKFKARARIGVVVKRKTTSIKLNAKDLKSFKAFVESKGTRQAVRVSVYPRSQEVVLRFRKPVSGPALLDISFTGEHNDKLYGFYRSSYEDSRGIKGVMLSSQFEATDARAAFPCFDEPAFKATFDVSIAAPKGFTAVSNTPVKRETPLGKGRTLFEFETSPKMSTYLLYLGVGKYDFIEGTHRNVRVRVLTVPGKRKLAGLALDYALKFLDFFEKYFRVDYPLAKLDLLAIPDFSSGAMENWGAITFREVTLLASEESAVATKQNIAMIIAHELAHQWFGNLVTMEWWDDLWLNESFATFTAYKAVHSVFPEWEFGLQYYEDTIATALAADQLKSTHAINVPVKDPEEVDAIFDRISYEKGGTVLQMLEDFVGKDAFRDGLTNYLREHAYSNARKQDLWNAVQKAASGSPEGKQVSRLMSHWVNEPGYPIVYVQKTGNGFTLTQKRFTLSGDLNARPWPIPLTYKASSGVHKDLMASTEFTAKNAGPWIKANAGQKGLYRVSYPQSVLEDLGVLAGYGKLSIEDAWGVESDLFAFTRSGRYPVRDYLEFVREHLLDLGYPVNSSVSGHLAWIQLIGANSGFERRAKNASIEFHERLLEKLGWEKRASEKNVETLLRSAAVSSLGFNGHASTVSRSRDLLEGFFSNGKELPSDLRSAVFHVNAWNGSRNLFNEFKSRYLKEKIPEDKRRYLTALAFFSDPALVGTALEFSLSKSVRLQDSFIIPRAMVSTPVGAGLVWNWTKKNWGYLLRHCSAGTHLLPRFVSGLSVASSEKDLREIKSFYAQGKNKRKDFEREVRYSLEKIQANLAFLEKNA